MEKQADLHVHTNLSDGTFSPKEVVENARKVGL
jgi:predicted metal-dependent phosphoesterase TrpH